MREEFNPPERSLVAATVTIAATCTGLVAVQLFEQRGPRQHAGGYDYSVRGQVGWIGIFLTLVCVDSAVFSIIQQTPELKLATWTDGPRLWFNAGVHLAAGVGAGLRLDRRWVAGTVGVATALFLVRHRDRRRGRAGPHTPALRSTPLHRGDPN